MAFIAEEVHEEPHIPCRDGGHEGGSRQSPTMRGCLRDEGSSGTGPQLPSHGIGAEAAAVHRRYHGMQAISHGAYGIVSSAKDISTGEDVALKRIDGVFDDLLTAKHTLRELRILRHLRHENLIEVKNVVIAGSRESYKTIYVVCELMDMDLGSILRSEQVFTDQHLQLFLYQLLRGLKYMHSAVVIHRDIKPQNLLVNCNCDLKICDLGLARVNFPEIQTSNPMTDYVCSRWYRAPEVLCAWTDYTAAIDVWSSGCILAELYTCRSFFPGANTQDQLEKIIAFLGSPSEEELQHLPNEKQRRWLGMQPRVPARPLKESIPKAPDLALELLKGLLRWSPEERPTVVEALQHSYLEKWSCPEDEPVREPLETADFEFEQWQASMEYFRTEIVRESLYFDPERLEEFDRELRTESGVHVNQPCEAHTSPNEED